MMVYYQTDNSTKPYNYNKRINTDYCFPLHLHRDFELAYVEGGCCTLTVDGKAQELKVGEFALILPNCIHSYYTKEKSKVSVYVFSKEYVSEFHKLCKNKVCDINCFFMKEEEKTVFLNALVSKAPTILDITVAMNIACSAFYKHNGTNFKKSSFSSTDNLMHKILNIITERYKEDISLKGLAKELGYEEHYISRCFNKYFGKNFKAFINELRISFAIEYMNKNPNLTITQIALASGFQSVRSFNRAYKTIMGTTPKNSKQ
ncbi:MAG: AraC family transcriptional regulator [Ruminococcaceae bacterium]|nr:AraC family transcriptional regulator [Oscillospiraceae bacterium]